MKKSNISFYFIFIAFSTFVTLFFLIIQKSYTNLVGPTQQVENNALLKPLDPNLGIDILKEIENRPEYTDDGTFEFNQAASQSASVSNF
jgi:hypothetical protein